MIALTGETYEERQGWEGTVSETFRFIDERLYSNIPAPNVKATIPGSILFTGAAGEVDVNQIGKPEDHVRVIASWKHKGAKTGPSTEEGEGDWDTTGFVLQNGLWAPVRVIVTPTWDELFSRTKGIIETALLSDKTVFSAGLGSLWSPGVLEMGRLGLNQILMDPDIIELHNVVRNPPGLSDNGRFKTDYLCEKLLDTNPYASIETHEVKVCWDTRELVRENVRKSDLTICGLDDDTARLILNKICIEENKPLIAGGALPRAFGGQVLVVHPKKSPCLQCFMMDLPDKLKAREISTPEQAARLGYTDRPVKAEPGLSNDIAPLGQMMVKLAIQELLKGKETTLKSLDEDLVAPWFMWLNRREAGTEYEGLKPLKYNIDGMHIMGWYGIAFNQNENCPACGDLMGNVARAEGITLKPEDAEKFYQE